jgi:penicillin V acylase-like amidase (Ntn superfamily)
MALFTIALASHESPACTGIILKARDGAGVYGRTLEWGTFDLQEFLQGELKIFDAPLGVITNAPGYDWHETNLRGTTSTSRRSPCRIRRSVNWTSNRSAEAAG